MPSRRTTLRLLGVSLLGGCVGRSPNGTTDTPTGTRTQQQSTTTAAPTDLDPGTPARWPPAEWSPAWSLSFDHSHVLGVDRDAKHLLVTASSRGGSSVLAVGPATRETVWRTDLPGRALNRSHLAHDHASGWGVTVVDDTVLAVTEETAGRPPTRLHGLDRATGARRWTLERDEQLRVRGVVDGTAVVHGAYVADEPTTHVDHGGTDTPTPTPKPATVYAVDVADGSVEWSRAHDGIRTVGAGASGVYVAMLNSLVAYGHDGSRRWAIDADYLTRDVYVAPDRVRLVTMPDWSRSVVHDLSVGGDERWRQSVRADETAVHDGTLFAAGRGLWRFGADGLDWQASVYAGWLTFGPEGSVYVRTGVQADAVTAFGADSGARAWVFDPPLSNAWAEVATADSVVAGGIGEAGQPLYRVDADTGEPTGRYLGLDPMVVEPGDETVFVGSGSHEQGAAKLLAFDA